MNPPLRRWLPMLAVAFSFTLLGCGEKPGIESYTVQREGVTLSSARPAPPVPMATSTGDDMTLVTMVQDGETTWFFKTTGSRAAMQQDIVDVARIINSIAFEGGQPTWGLPSGWQELPGDGFRHATLAKGTGAQRLELAISKLTRQGDQAQWELSNINRWLGELGYAPVDAEGLEQLIFRREVAGRPAILFQKEGTRGADPTRDPLAEAETSATAAPDPMDSIDFEVPEGWQPGEGNAFSNDAYVIGTGEEQVEVTVSAMRPSPLAANVNRWRGQVGLASQSEEEINASMQTLSVAGEDAPYFELTGTSRATGEPQTILVVVAQANGTQWYFKMWGTPEAVAAEKQRFEDFIESIEFE